MDITAYFQRIHFAAAEADGLPAPTAENLRALQRAHLYAVPFENLDIPLGREIVLDYERLYQKIVARRRGGFCYELNGLFAQLLEALGYQVTLLSARVVGSDGGCGPEYDHLVLQVYCPADAHPEIPWLVDVGFGDSFVDPLRLDVSGEQPEGRRAYRIDREGENLDLWRKNFDGTWEKQYRFTLQPRAFREFEEMCMYQQTSPESGFTKKRSITRATPTGRVTLSEYRVIRTMKGEREFGEVANEEEYTAFLRENFDVEL